MSVALVPETEGDGPKAYSLEAEQSLLGCLLYDNGAVERLPEALRGEHFIEPFHHWLFDQVVGLVSSGQFAEPILIAERATGLPSFEPLGGVRYLADLVDRAPPSNMAPHAANIILDLALRRDLIRIAEDAAANARKDRETSARDHIEEVEGQLFGLAESKSSVGFQTFSQNLAGAVAMAAKAYERDGGLSGLSTGLADLDQKLGGLHPSDLVIIAARPAMGKTALAANVAFHVANRYAYEALPGGRTKTKDGGIVAFYSLEMSGEQLALRILGERSGVSSDRLRKGDVRPDEFGRVRDAAVEIDQAPLHIDATGGLAIAKLGARARRLKRTSGLDLIVVDYLQLVTANAYRGDRNRVQEVSEITQGLKALAKELSVPVIALSQLSRAVESREDKRPQLSDLRESGSIEQDADVVMFLYREEYYLGRSEPKAGTEAHQKWLDSMDACRGQAELIIAKQRHGPIGTVRLAFNADLTKFSNLAREARFDLRGSNVPYRGDQ